MKSVFLCSDHPFAPALVGRAITKVRPGARANESEVGFVDSTYGRFFLYDCTAGLAVEEPDWPSAESIGLTERLDQLVFMAVECRTAKLIADTLNAVASIVEIPLLVIDGAGSIIPAHQLTCDNFEF